MQKPLRENIMLKSLADDDPSNDATYLADTPILQIKTTPGVGDFMYPLNKALMAHHRTKQDFHVEFVWTHSEDHYHHFEDPETIIERYNYILPFFHNYKTLTYSHVFNAEILPRLQRLRYVSNLAMQSITELECYNIPKVINDAANWKFKPSNLVIDTNKVVIWRPLFNAEPAVKWKNVVSNNMWEDIISILKNFGFNVVELTYRTPIREAHYEIATCDFCVAYDGMWHYIAKNYWKPMIVASRSNITKLHSPQAIMLHEAAEIKGKVTGREIVSNMKNFLKPSEAYGGLTLYQFIHNKADRYNKSFEKWYSECK